MDTEMPPSSGAIGAPPELSATERTAFLAEIPTETTPAERELLWNWFEREWDGAGHVIEIGPFLGGTTRAIASGMLRNLQRSPAARLHTYDRFGDYYTPGDLRGMIDPVARSGTLTAAEADRLCATGDFLQLFDAIHRSQDYFPLIEAHNSALPDFPNEIDRATTFDNLATDEELGAVFVDGCKSWASTHYAMKFLLPRLRPGAPVIFQDFGWYTCFWISSAVHALCDVLEFRTNADATYVYRLTRHVSAQEVARRFARTPDAIGRSFFRQAADALLAQSRSRGDLRGELISILHHVAALVTIGRRADAAALLNTLDVRRYAAWAYMIRGCIKSPTYLPGGKKLLWQEST